MYTCLQLVDQFKVDLETQIMIDQDASKVDGTSAFLQQGDLLTLRDLMYGMMLPSGNDAAF